MPKRRRSREIAVQFVYQWSLNDVKMEELKERALFFWNQQTEASEENRDYYLRSTLGTVSKLPEIDALLQKTMTNWRLDRVEKVELAVLRNAIFELLFEEEEHRSDRAVIIDEAVNIAKKFASKDSGSFVNGILDKIAVD